MLINRALIIGLLMLVGLVVMSISVWILAFDPSSSTVPVLSLRWILQYLPVVIGAALIILGFRMLSTTRVPQPTLSDDDPAP